MRITTLATILMVMTAGLVGAADRNGQFRVEGGIDGDRYYCASYIVLRREVPNWEQYKSTSHVDNYWPWINGFITAYNVITPRTYSIRGDRPHTSLLLWLETWCKSHPLGHIGTGLAALFRELHATRFMVKPK